MQSIYRKMEKDLARKQKYGMDPLPVDPRLEQMYPGMGKDEKVLDAVQAIRDRDWAELNDRIRNNEPASPQEIADFVERNPHINIDDPVNLEQEIKRVRQANLLYGKTGEPTFDEIQKAKNYIISDGITVMQKKQLEAAADAWHKEHGNFSGWDAKREELINDMVGN